MRDADEVAADADLRVRLARGELSARVTGVRVPLDAAALPTPIPGAGEPPERPEGPRGGDDAPATSSAGPQPGAP